METIIGKTYIPSDNSFLLNLTTGLDCRLAGSLNPDILPKQTIVVSEPYEFRVRIAYLSSSNLLTFINVQYKEDVYRVMYKEENLNRSLEEAYETHKSQVISIMSEY